MRTRVKICGITREEDARAAVEAGCDAIGLVFHARSPRAVSLDQAGAILARLPPFVTRVGLFMDAGTARVREALAALSLDLVQFHGRESPVDCDACGVDYLKAVPMAEPGGARAFMARYPGARGFLLDSHGPGQAGGTGRTFDWGDWPGDMDRPLILAGGLDPDNVATAIARTRPWAVDVSSGVEAAPGIKDPGRITRFMSEVRRVDREPTGA
ncbi:MAG: phosphoribosylanthranilate isomerase [Ectothiorhodospira sp.]